MARLPYILLTLTIISCGKPQSQKQVSDKTDSLQPTLVAARSTPTGQDTAEGQYQEGTTATYFVVVADTGVYYANLRQQMLGYQTPLRQSIDTMGRTYSKAKDLIALPDNSEDLVYAGDYYPRRFPSSTLSIEFMDVYHETSSDKSMALIAGIYEQQRTADSALMILKKFSPRAFAIKSTLSADCLH
ncbi:hypothetical protein [Spirosoma aerophilum]